MISEKTDTSTLEPKDETHSLDEKKELIPGIPDKALWGIIGAIILLIIIVVLVIMKKRNKPSQSLYESDIQKNNMSSDYSALTGLSQEKPPAQSCTTSLDSDSVSEGFSALMLSIPEKGTNFPLTSGTITIGAYPDNALAIEEEIVSGYHAEISGNGEQWILKDLGSTNGTRLNDQLITGPVVILEGDVIRIGKTHIRVSKP